MSKKVGVSIVTYNAADYIRGCLTSLYKNTYPNISCAVVDNASSDETISKIRHKFAQVKIFINKTNRGFAAAHNQAIRYFLSKKSDYILILNPDTLVKSSLIQELVDTLEQDLNIGVAGPIIIYHQNPAKIWFAGGKFNQSFTITKHPFMDQQLKSVKIKTTTVDFITGACMMIRTDIFKKVGLLPQEYFLYFEDVFFCQKVRNLGYSCWLVAKPLAKHFVSTSTGRIGTNTLTPLRAYYYARNPLIYINSNIKGVQKLTAFFGQFFIRLPYYLYSMIKDKSFNAIPYYIRGLTDGLHRS